MSRCIMRFPLSKRVDSKYKAENSTEEYFQCHFPSTQYSDGGGQEWGFE